MRGMVSLGWFEGKGWGEIGCEYLVLGGAGPVQPIVTECVNRLVSKPEYILNVLAS